MIANTRDLQFLVSMRNQFSDWNPIKTSSSQTQSKTFFQFLNKNLNKWIGWRKKILGELLNILIGLKIILIISIIWSEHCIKRIKFIRRHLVMRKLSRWGKDWKQSGTPWTKSIRSWPTWEWSIQWASRTGRLNTRRNSLRLKQISRNLIKIMFLFSDYLL